MLTSKDSLVACLMIHTHFHNDLGLSRATAVHYIWRQLCSKHVIHKFGMLDDHCAYVTHKSRTLEIPWTYADLR